MLFEIFIGLKIIVTKYIRLSPGPAIEKICSYLKSVPGENIMCLPIDTCFMFAYFTRKKVMFAFSADAFEAFSELLFGSPREKQHSIDYIFVDSTFYLPDELDLGAVETIMVEDGYYLLRVIRNA